MGRARLARHALIAGLLLSGLVHLLFMRTPAWDLTQPAREMPIDVRVLILPTEVAPVAVAPPPPPPPPPAPKPVPLPRIERPAAVTAIAPTPVAPVVVASDAPQSVLGESTSGPSGPAEGTSTPAGTASGPVAAADLIAMIPAAQKLPRSVLVGFRAKGEVGWALGRLPFEGQGEQGWMLDEIDAGVQTYRATMSASTAGYALGWTAQGRLQAGAPVVIEMRDARSYKPEGVATVDAATGTIRQSRGKDQRERVAAGVIVDFASLPMFFAAVGDQIDAVELTVIGGYTVETVVVVQDPPKMLNLPIGEHLARQFHAEAGRGKLKIDVWISKQWPGIPVRIRIEQESDFLIDMVAESIRIDGDLQIYAPRPLIGNE